MKRKILLISFLLMFIYNININIALALEGTLSVSPTSFYAGKCTTVTVSGSTDDPAGMWEVGYKTTYPPWPGWHWESCGGAASCTKSWDFCPSDAGTYTVYGKVRDHDVGYADTTPASITVTVNKCTSSDNCIRSGWTEVGRETMYPYGIYMCKTPCTQTTQCAKFYCHMDRCSVGDWNLDACMEVCGANCDEYRYREWKYSLTGCKYDDVYEAQWGCDEKSGESPKCGYYYKHIPASASVVEDCGMYGCYDTYNVNGGAGHCYTSCTSRSECKSGYVCISNQCVECTSTTQCRNQYGSSYVCSGGKCEIPPPPPPDTTPPVRSNGQPTGTINYDNPTLSLTTNEAATCRYSTTAGTSYDSMTNTFSTTGGTSHSQSLSGLSEGIHNYYVRCKDGAGNKNTDDYTISFTVVLDTTPPESVSISVTPPEVVTTWQNTDATSDVSCSDAGSGCNSTTYKLNITSYNPINCPNNYNQYTLASPQTISSHSWVCAAAKDNADNVNFSSPMEFKVDQIQPTITDNYTYDGVWINIDQTIKLNSQDTGDSGIKNVSYCEGIACTPNILLASPYELHYTATDITVRYQTWDNAINPSTIGEFSIKLDKIKPNSSVISPVAGSWQNETFNILINYSDSGGSGLKDCEYRVVSDGIQAYPAVGWALAGICSADETILPQSITAGIGMNCTDQGINKCTIYTRANDTAGNVGDENSSSFSIDWTEPDLFSKAYILDKEILDNSIVWADNPITLITNATDSFSGINETKILYWVFYTNNGSLADYGENACSGNCSITKVFGSNLNITYKGIVIDNAGNTNETVNHTFRTIFSPVEFLTIAEELYLPLGSHEYLPVRVSNIQLIEDKVQLKLKDYEFAKFVNVTGELSSDKRELNITLEPSRTEIIYVMVYTSDTGEFDLNLTAKFISIDKEFYNELKIKVGYPAEFSGLNNFAIILLMLLAGLIYCVSLRKS